MSFSLIPSCVADSIYVLTPSALAAHGIRLVLADLDNTLTSYEDSMPCAQLKTWKADLEANGITLFVVSNSRKSHRCPDFCTALGIGCIRHAGKPGIDGFLRALMETGHTADQALMVGDQIFTDIYGANRAGVQSVLVKPIAIGKNPFRAVRYAIESPFRWLGCRRCRIRESGGTVQ